MSTWNIGGYYAGLAFRESKDHKFKDGSPFLPHVIRKNENIQNIFQSTAFVNKDDRELFN